MFTGLDSSSDNSLSESEGGRQEEGSLNLSVAVCSFVFLPSTKLFM